MREKTGYDMTFEREREGERERKEKSVYRLAVAMGSCDVTGTTVGDVTTVGTVVETIVGNTVEVGALCGTRLDGTSDPSADGIDAI